jgi:hypothetical protein
MRLCSRATGTTSHQATERRDKKNNKTGKEDHTMFRAFTPPTIRTVDLPFVGFHVYERQPDGTWLLLVRDRGTHPHIGKTHRKPAVADKSEK